ncbi:hypothetical protein [Salibacterium aidingense]|uniref:hypothetical protein n=1 Tax=Salibacterium aidingense TaxID=384933 RepID=UPI00040BD75A|nr:hypothetical protein [Salibacterium aidingense]
MNLPTLKGSEKQVKWAEQIRANTVKAWEAFEGLAPVKNAEKFELTKQSVREYLKDENAAFFIDNHKNASKSVQQALLEFQDLREILESGYGVQRCNMKVAHELFGVEA